MGFITGIAAVKEQQAKQPQREDYSERPKAEWVSIKNGDTVKITPLQEIDEGSPNFLESNGTSIFSLQHSNPDNWQKNAECTLDEGDCYGCARGWRQKTVFYMNVLVDDGKRAPYVAILSRGLGKGSVAQELVNIASDEDFDNSVSDKTYKLTRNVDKKDTTYSLTALPKAHTYNLSDYADKLFDLPKYVFHVAPSKQEDYYTDGQGAPQSQPAAPTASDVDNDW